MRYEIGVKGDPIVAFWPSILNLLFCHLLPFEQGLLKYSTVNVIFASIKNCKGTSPNIISGTYCQMNRCHSQRRKLTDSLTMKQIY
jgi:hypothetical protein